MFSNNFGGVYMGSPYYGGLGQSDGWSKAYSQYPYCPPPKMSTDETLYDIKNFLSASYFVIECRADERSLGGENINIGYFCINKTTNKCYISRIFTLDSLHHYSDLSDKMILFKKFIEKYNSDENNTKITTANMFAIRIDTTGKSIPIFDSKPLKPDETESISIDELNKEE